MWWYRPRSSRPQSVRTKPSRGWSWRTESASTLRHYPRQRGIRAQNRRARCKQARPEPSVDSSGDHHGERGDRAGGVHRALQERLHSRPLELVPLASRLRAGGPGRGGRTQREKAQGRPASLLLRQARFTASLRLRRRQADERSLRDRRRHRRGTGRARAHDPDCAHRAAVDGGRRGRHRGRVRPWSGRKRRCAALSALRERR